MNPMEEATVSAQPNSPHRWVMTAAGEAMVRVAMDATPGEGEVVVQVAGCGVCHTDLGYYYDGVRTNQPLPLALGHEISGRVRQAGAGAEAWVGKAVIVHAMPDDYKSQPTGNAGARLACGVIQKK